MFLKRLSLTRGDHQIRDVSFKRGLNLILDAPTAHQTQTGNSVGKSTVLRVVDFCLGSDGNDIWQDSEFKKNNEDLILFLTEPEPITARLEIESIIGTKHSLSRTFKAPSEGKFVAHIDDDRFSRFGEYVDRVRTILFGSPGPKPTLRQLVPKFVRSSPQKMNKTLLYLGDFSDKTTYETIYLFLFGFFDVEILEKRPKLVKQLRDIERDLLALRRLRSEGELDQIVRHLQTEIAAKETVLKQAGESVDFTKNIEIVGAIRAEAASISTQLTRLETERTYQLRTIQEFDKSKSEIDLRLIRQVYEEAKSFFPKLQKEFEEISTFIQALHTRKLDYLKSRIPETESAISQAKKKLSILIERESKALTPVRDELLNTDFSSLRDRLRDDYLQMGALREAAKNFESLHRASETAASQLAETQKRLLKARQSLQDNIEVFNTYFAKFSQELYEEAYLLHFDEDKSGSFKFSITDVGDNVGTGKKATQTAAFDLAYMQFLSEMNFGFPRFALHDGLESVHDNQLAVLLEKADDPSGQLIVATLRDKLPSLDAKFLKKNTILELSEENKFFRFS